MSLEPDTREMRKKRWDVPRGGYLLLMRTTFLHPVVFPIRCSCLLKHSNKKKEHNNYTEHSTTSYCKRRHVEDLTRDWINPWLEVSLAFNNPRARRVDIIFFELKLNLGFDQSTNHLLTRPNANHSMSSPLSRPSCIIGISSLHEGGNPLPPTKVDALFSKNPKKRRRI